MIHTDFKFLISILNIRILVLKFVIVIESLFHHDLKLFLKLD